MPASYLRTNYRKTGGNLDITAFGPGIELASAAGGAGTTKTFGGAMVFSFAHSFNDDAVGVSAGFSNAFVQSTIGTLSLYYGSGIFPDSGYRFMPVFFQLLSFSDTAYAGFAAGASIPWIQIIKTSNYNSIWTISAIRHSVAFSSSHVSGLLCRALITGFIVSIP